MNDVPALRFPCSLEHLFELLLCLSLKLHVSPKGCDEPAATRDGRARRCDAKRIESCWTTPLYALTAHHSRWNSCVVALLMCESSESHSCLVEVHVDITGPAVAILLNTEVELLFVILDSTVDEYRRVRVLLDLSRTFEL